jgi:hypothetical protein
MTISRTWNLRLNIDEFNAAYATLVKEGDHALFLAGLFAGINNASLDDPTGPLGIGFLIGQGMRMEAEEFRAMKKTVGGRGGRPKNNLLVNQQVDQQVNQVVYQQVDLLVNPIHNPQSFNPITPNHNPKKPTRQKQPSWNQKFPLDVVEATNEILEFWPDGKKDIQPKKCAADPTQYVPETHSRFLAARLADIQQEGGDLKICVEIAKQYVDSYKRGRNWVKAAEYFFGKTEDAKWKAYYQSEITNREIEAHETDPA